MRVLRPALLRRDDAQARGVPPLRERETPSLYVRYLLLTLLTIEDNNMTHVVEETDTERNWLALRNELDRTRGERDSWEAQFHSAAAAASQYSEFWERHNGDFDMAGNYIPHSQMDGDLRATKAEIKRLKALALTKDELREAVEYVVDKFKKDEAQDYHTKDREFAITILGKALAACRCPAVSNNLSQCPVCAKRVANPCASVDAAMSCSLSDQGPFYGQVDAIRIISTILGGGTVAQYSTAVAIVDGLKSAGLMVVSSRSPEVSNG
jgi:hypothetical protein